MSVSKDSISGALLKRRIELEITQQQACKFVGISQSALSKIESGKLGVSLEDWEKFCELYRFQFSLPDLYSGKTLRKDIKTFRKEKKKLKTWLSDVCKRQNRI